MYDFFVFMSLLFKVYIDLIMKRSEKGVENRSKTCRGGAKNRDHLTYCTRDVVVNC